MNAPTQFAFDDRNVRWFPLGDFPHVEFAMLSLDRERRLVDLLIRFAASQRIFLHRHLVQTNILVIQGEHRLYEPDGRLKEIRKVGSYTATAGGGAPHYEGAGDVDCILAYSLRGEERDEMFEVMDDQQNVIGHLGMPDFVAAWDAQHPDR